MTIWGFINVYASGKYHTPGKPGAFDRHGGDMYTTKAAAFTAVDHSPEAKYIDTVPVGWWEDSRPEVNKL